MKAVNFSRSDLAEYTELRVHPVCREERFVRYKESGGGNSVHLNIEVTVAKNCITFKQRSHHMPTMYHREIHRAIENGVTWLLNDQ